MSTSHLPLNAEATTVLAVKDQDGKQTQLAVSQLTDDIKFQVQLMDDMRQRQYNAYHAFNRARLALSAQQQQVQIMLNDFIEQQNKQATENSTDNK